MSTSPEIKGRPLRGIRGWLTNVDPADSPEDYAEEFNGYRALSSGLIDKDAGTIQRSSAYPSGIRMRGGRVVTDPSTAKRHQIIAGLNTSDKTRLFVDETGDYSGTWKALTRKIVCRIVSLTYNSTPKTTTITMSVPAEDGASIAIAADELAGHVVVNETPNPYQFARILSNTATAAVGGNFTITVLGNMTPAIPVVADWPATGWCSITPTASAYVAFQENNGAAPHFRWNPIDALKEVTVYYGRHDTRTYRIPMEIQKHAAMSSFYTTDVPSNIPRLSWPARWSMNVGGGGYCPTHVYLGSATAGISALTGGVGGLEKDIYEFPDRGETIQDSSTWSFLRLGVYVTDTTTPIYRNGSIVVWILVVITLLYGEDETDPVATAYCGATVPSQSPILAMSYAFNPGLMHDKLTGIRMYTKTLNVLEVNNGLQDIYLADVTLAKEILFNEAEPGSEFTVTVQAPSADRKEKVLVISHNYNIPAVQLGSQWQEVQNGGPSISTMLGHAPDRDRSYVTPRYFVRSSTTRTQGAAVIIDVTDRFARISAFGNGIHMDGTFPDVSVTTANSRGKIILIGQGEILGISQVAGTILFHREDALETFDLNSGRQEIVPFDTISRDSICETPLGIAFMGRSGPWLMPASGAGVRYLGNDIGNLFDGREQLLDGTPVISAESMAASLIGYDPAFRDLWIQLRMNTEAGAVYTMARFFLEQTAPEGGHWAERRLNFGSDIPVLWFDKAGESSFVIGYESGILEYPNVHIGFAHLDCVGWDGAAPIAGTGQGFAARIKAVLSGWANSYRGVILDHARVKYRYRASAAAKFVFSIFPDRKSTVSEERSIWMDKDWPPIGLPPWGEMVEPVIVLDLSAADAAVVEQLQIQEMSIFGKLGESAHA